MPSVDRVNGVQCQIRERWSKSADKWDGLTLNSLSRGTLEGILGVFHTGEARQR